MIPEARRLVAPWTPPLVVRGRLDQTGSLTAFVAVLMLMLVALLGLVVDGGRATAAHESLEADAQQAARLGASQISVTLLRSGRVSIEPGSAVATAETFLQEEGVSGRAEATDSTVTVQVQQTVPTVLLGIVGINELSVSTQATATDVHGVTRND